MDEALIQVCSDYERGLLETTKFRGSFCLVFLEELSVRFLTDAGNMFSIFADAEQGIVSSSLQAVLVTSGRKQTIHPDALCEQLVVGTTTGLDTCFEHIKRVNGCGDLNLGGVVGFCQQATTDELPEPPRMTGRDSWIEWQLQILREYFMMVRMIAGPGGISVGLSSGFDSRLILLLAIEAGIQVHPFSYFSNHHTNEYSIASLIADHTGLNLRPVKVRAVDVLEPKDIAQNANDSILFFDGRTNATMGTFNDVHTLKTQVKCLGPASLHLNGLGGELYRNRERLPRYRFSFKDWLRYYVIAPDSRHYFSSLSARANFEKRLAEKYNSLLGSDHLRWIDRKFARQYYRDIWLPFSAGPRVSADNLVSAALMPFSEATTSLGALKVTRFIGPHGAFEAAMIRRLNDGVASLPSEYGPQFGCRTKIERLRNLLYSSTPLQARRLRYTLRRRCTRPGNQIGPQLMKRFAAAIAYLKTSKVPLNINQLLISRYSRDRTLFVAESLYRFRDHISME